MMKKIYSFTPIVIVTILALSYSFKQDGEKGTQLDSNRQVILKIAMDTAVKVYGANVINNELPLVATLKNDSIWVVWGTLPEGWDGGTVYIEILNRNKKVIKITHYK